MLTYLYDMKFDSEPKLKSGITAQYNPILWHESYCGNQYNTTKKKSYFIFIVHKAMYSQNLNVIRESRQEL